jgi:RNA recognition motif
MVLSGKCCEACWWRYARGICGVHEGAISVPVFQKQERSRNIFVGNVAREVTDTALRKVFEPCGHVASATVMRAKFNGESRGFGCVDMPASAEAQSMPLGGSAYKAHRDATLLADAGHKVEQFLEGFSQRCAEAGGTYHILQDTGLPAAHILLEAQHYDLIMLGQHTFFHFETQDTPDDTLSVVVKQNPCPVVAVPATLPEGRAVVVAYDGSAHATRALHMCQALRLDSAYDVHVVCVDAQQARATHCVARHGLPPRAQCGGPGARPGDLSLPRPRARAVRAPGAGGLADHG